MSENLSTGALQQPTTPDGDALRRLISALNGVLLGKEVEVKLAVACMLARGHLLIDGPPGVGKTVLSHALAACLGLEFRRIQFTSDLLPSDILGVSVYSQQTETFQLHKGPIFTQVVLADEINRATPRTQSALLEAMEERQVTIDGQTLTLPEPFFVIATQNPTQQLGTFPLPESQLDRFLLRIDLSYPGRDAEREVFAGRDRRHLIADLGPCLNAEELKALHRQVDGARTSEALLDYVQDLIAYTRDSGKFAVGLSTRAGIALLRLARAWAVIDGREDTLPEDVQAVFPSLARHRLQVIDDLSSAHDISEQIIHAVPIP